MVATKLKVSQLEATTTVDDPGVDTSIPTEKAVRDALDAIPGGGDVATDPIWDAKGDLAAGTGANTASKLTVGTNGKYLKADSGETTGLKWDTPAGAGDVLGPDTSTDEHLAVWDGTDSKTLKDGGAVPAAVSTDGWIDPGETWTYASASTFTVPGNQTAVYTIGLKLKCTDNSTVKYFYVLNSAFGTATTVTITGGTDYSLAGGAISLNYYSRVQSPQGFPDWFNYVPTWSCINTNVDLQNGTLIGMFKIEHKLVTVAVKITMGSSTTFGGGDPFRWLMPTSPLGFAMDGFNGSARMLDSGTAHFIGSSETLTTSSVDYAVVYCYNVTNACRSIVPFTWAVNDRLQFTIAYGVP